MPPDLAHLGELLEKSSLVGAVTTMAYNCPAVTGTLKPGKSPSAPPDNCPGYGPV
jgi:hypothetical protein